MQILAVFIRLLPVIAIIAIVAAVVIPKLRSKSAYTVNSSGQYGSSVQGLSSDIQERFKYIFAEASEQYVSSIGNGYISNFLLNNTLSKGFAIVSNKRVYFKGRCYYQNANGKLREQFTEEIVDLKDVTGSGYKRINPIGILVTALVLFVVALMLIIIAASNNNPIMILPAFLLMILGPGITIIVYIIKCITTFEISFAGGRIAFDTNLYSKAEIDDFQKQLRLAKDNIVSSMATVQTVNISNPKTGIADEIKKYSELLQQGAITQEEYKHLKKELIKSLII